MGIDLLYNSTSAIFTQTTILDQHWVLTLLIIFASCLFITTNITAWKVLLFPIAVGFQLIGLNVPYFILFITMLIYVIGALSLQSLAKVIKSATETIATATTKVFTGEATRGARDWITGRDMKRQRQLADLAYKSTDRQITQQYAALDNKKEIDEYLKATKYEWLAKKGKDPYTDMELGIQAALHNKRTLGDTENIRLQRELATEKNTVQHRFNILQRDILNASKRLEEHLPLSIQTKDVFKVALLDMLGKESPFGLNPLSEQLVDKFVENKLSKWRYDG